MELRSLSLLSSKTCLISSSLPVQQGLPELQVLR